jgi:hypothetical protein
MSLARIKQQAEQADQMIRGLNQPTGEQGESEQPTTTEVVDESTPELAGDDQGVVATEAPPQASPDTEQLRKEAETWEQRYRSLDGMIRARDKQIQQLHDLLASMQQQPQQPQFAETNAPLLTEKDETDFGSDLIDMARRAAREEFRTLKAEILNEVGELRQNLQGVNEVTQMTAQDRFEMKLDELTKKQWRVLDTDQGFINWLKDRSTRLKIFTAAVQGQDATTVADYFNDYAEMANQQRVQEDVPRQTRKAEVERQVSPGKSKSMGTPDSQASGKKVWTRTEISQTYANKKQFQADEFQKLEREIATAQREGRVNYAA